MADNSRKVDLGGMDIVCKGLYVGATTPGAAGSNISSTELGFIDGVTAGTAAASKALVLDGSLGISTITSATITTLTSTTVNSAALTGTTTLTMTSANAAALAVGLAGATNPAFVVDSSTASQAAGWKITGATAAGTVAGAVISSGADANLTFNAKGTGTIGIGTVSTGAVTITPATTITGVLTNPGGYTSTGGAQLYSGTAVPAGGTAATGLKVSSTSNLGLFFGSGAPSLAAAQGSIYIRTDGSSTVTRLYSNSTSSTTWVAMVSVS